MVFQDNELNRISRLFNQIIVETYGLDPKTSTRFPSFLHRLA